MPGLTSFDEAITLLAKSVDPLGCEMVRLEDAHGRYLAQDLIASLDAPRCDVSTMDGYALADGSSANNGWLEVVGEARPGLPFGGSLGASQAIRIFTGAPIPRGAEFVIMQEYAERNSSRVRFREGHGSASHIRRAGSDFRRDDTLLPAGARLTAQAMISAAAADREVIRVSKRPRVAIIATGDELVRPGSASQTVTQVPESASYGVTGLASRAGALVIPPTHGPDDADHLARLGLEAVDQADCIVVIGGASVGEYDMARSIVGASELEQVFSKVAIKPGKPVWLGKAGTKTVLGLPGNPTSAFVTARLFLCPLLAALQGGKADACLSFLPMRLAARLPEAGDRETFWRARATAAGLVPSANQDSGAQAPLAESDWLIRQAPNADPSRIGELVPALGFQSS